MKIVVGLGNPGRKYKDTPHNAGFAAVEKLAERCDTRLKRSWRTSAKLGKCMCAGDKMLLVEPLTFMNRSGDAVSSVVRYNRLEAKDLIVIVDDADLPAGRIRVRASGSSGGHNGLESVIRSVGTRDFVRIRVGVGRGKGSSDLVSHVLSPLKGERAELFSRGVETAADAVECIVEYDVEKAMNEFNGVKPEGDSNGESQ